MASSNLKPIFGPPDPATEPASESQPEPESPKSSPKLFEVPRSLLREALAVLWLVPAAALLLFANGRWMLPVAAWLAPIFLLRFVRSQRLLVGAVLGTAVAIPIAGVIWRGMLPSAGHSHTVVNAAMALVLIAPYVIDRVLSPRISSFFSSLVFPTAAVVIEYVVTTVSPWGTWGAVAYTQTDDLPLLQVVAYTGIWGVTFLVAWLASSVNDVWERGENNFGAKLAVLAFVTVFVGAHLLGGVRLRANTGRETVRVASYTVTADPPVSVRELARSRDGSALEAQKGRLGSLRESLLARASQEAKAGARIVFWSEGNAVIGREEEDNFISDGATVAHDEGVYLGMAFAEVDPAHGSWQNRFVVMDPMGEIVADYHKSRPVPGDPETGSDRHPPTISTPHGLVSGAIGFDADFPALVQDAGESRADVMLLPAADWPGVDPLHARMATVRGIENGCAVVRQTRGGLSLATDSRGRTLAAVEAFEGDPRVMVAQVPVHGEPTFYSRFGDAFAWVCLVVLALFMGLGLRASRPAPAVVPVPEAAPAD